MRIPLEKMTFLTANYGLSPEQVQAFYDAYQTTYYQQAGEIEYAWEEGGYFPDNPESAMIEVLVDADRLEDAMPDYMEWCFDFRFKQELAHDLLEVPMPKYNIEYLREKGMTSWMLRS